MSKKLYCANCGKEIKEDDDIYMCCDNFLQIKYFDDNSYNVFCSKDCACEYLSIESVLIEELPDDCFKEVLDNEN